MIPRQAALHTTTRSGTKVLFSRWRVQRDRCAREELVVRFLPLARQLAFRYARASEPTEDLVQVASLGLIGAIDRFDPDRGKSFSSFAVPTILGELKRHFRDHCWSLHVPRREQELALRLRDGERELTAELGRRPTVAQLAEHLDLSADEVDDGLEVTHATNRVSLDAPVQDEGESDGSQGDRVGCLDERYELVETTVSLASAMKRLPERDHDLLSMRLAENLTQQEIAERIGVSQVQVSRLLRASLRRLHELVDVGEHRVRAIAA